MAINPLIRQLWSQGRPLWPPVGNHKGCPYGSGEGVRGSSG